jgi:hypothetical protein
VDVATLQVDVRQAASASAVSEDQGVALLHIAEHAQLASDPPTSRSGARERSTRGRQRPAVRRERAAGDRCGGRPDARGRGPRRPRRHPAHECDPDRRSGAARRSLRQGASRAVRRIRPVAGRAFMDLGDPADPRRPDAGGARAHAVDGGSARVRDADLLREQLPRADTCVRQGRCGFPGGSGEQRVLRDHGGIGPAPPDEPHARGGGRPVGRGRRRLGDQRVRRSHGSRRVAGGAVPTGDPPTHGPVIERHHGVRPIRGLVPVASLVVVAGMVLVPRALGRPARSGALPPDDAGRS